MKRCFLAGLVVLLAGTALISEPIGALEPGDTAAPTQVLVNKFGAVSVSGVTDCSGTVAMLAERGVQGYFDQTTEQWVDEVVPVDLDASYLTVMVNADNWTVSQIQSKNGRKVTIQATYGSSKMTPCFNNDPTSPARGQCGLSGAPCAWTTNPYGWMGGTYWVVPPVGGFKKGTVHVAGFQAEGYVVMLTDKTSGAVQMYTTMDLYAPYGHMLNATLVR